MKKHTLKRYLASLLAVLMLISVTGISPAVFADSTPQLKTDSGTIKVIIKSGMTDAQVKDNLAKALLTNYEELSEEQLTSITWEYECVGYNKIDVGKVNPNTAWGSISGFTSQTGKLAKITYDHPALINQNDQSTFKVAINGNRNTYCTIMKVAKFDSNISVKSDVVDIALSYDDNGNVDEASLKQNIFDNYVTGTTPEGLTYSDLSYSGNFSEGTQTVTISYAGNDDYYSCSKPVTVNFTDSRAVAFTANAKPDSFNIGFVGNDVNVEATKQAVLKQLVNKVGDVELDQIKVEYNPTIGSYKDFSELSVSDIWWYTNTAKTDIRLTYAGDATHKPFSAEFKDLKFADNRVASSIAIKADASITYNMKADVMKQDIFDNVIDWENSKLPAKDTLTVNDFKFECKAALGWTDIAGDEYPNLDAGDGQTVKISFVGNSEYKPSDKEATINIAKADVAVSMNKFTTAYAGVEEDLSIENLGITLDPNDTRIDIYRIFAGINTNLKSSVNLVLTDEQWDVIVKISEVQAWLYDKAPKLFPSFNVTIKDKLEKGMTIGEFKALIAEIIDAIDEAEDMPVVGSGIKALLESLNIDLDSIKTMATIFDKLTEFSDDTTIALGVPQHAGLYRAYAVAVHKNYNTSYASGTVLILMNWKNMKIVPNEELKKHTITIAEAEEYAKGNKAAATLKCGDTAVNDQSSLHYRYTGLNTIYSSHEFPTKAGKYIVTVSVRGGDYYALPTTFIFTITAD